MTFVIRRESTPDIWNTTGKHTQSLLDTILNGGMQAAQLQNDQALRMIGFGMQERRRLDQNTRDDKRWAEQQTMQERQFAQQDKWRGEEMDLRKQTLGLQQAAAARQRALEDSLTQALSGKPGMPQRGNPELQAVIDGAIRSPLPGLPSLDFSYVPKPFASTDSPGSRAPLGDLLKPLGVSASTPPPATRSRIDEEEMREALRQLMGKGTPQTQPQVPQAPQATEMPQQLQTPQPPQMPEPATSGGFTVDTFPPQFMSLSQGRAVFDSLQARDAANMRRYQEDVKAHETAQKQAKNEQADMAKQDSAIKISTAALRSADESLSLLDKKFMGLIPASGVTAKNVLPGWNQARENLMEALRPMQTATMMEMIKELKEQSPSGALNMRITQLEAVMLSGILGSLEINQHPEQLRKNIVAHRKVYQESRDIAEAIQREKGYAQRQPAYPPLGTGADAGGTGNDPLGLRGAR